MPESKSKYVHQDLLVTADSSEAEDLLDLSELNTVLEMLAVIETVEELSMLECLTESQKRQVWAVTPEPVKQKLWQIRTTGAKAPLERSSQTISDSPHCNGVVLAPETQDQEDEADEEDEDLDRLDELDSELQVGQIRFAASPNLSAGSNNPVQVKDWVILKAHPKLNSAELKAIWQIVEVQGDYAKLITDKLGTRLYPISWMVLYPQPQSEPVQESLEDEADEIEF